MKALRLDQAIGVIGAGTMGAGIAQVAATAGHEVFLYDAMEGAAHKGRDRIVKGLEAQVERGKIDAQSALSISNRINIAGALNDLAETALVIEAIVEDIQVKQKLFTELESLLGATAILATNTSSISITAIGSALKNPARLVGMHFFNPAPVMKLVEVVSGLATERQIAETIFATAENWGKVAVHAKSTPGFIVNRVARSFYGEPLRLLEEGVADPATLDALFREGGGFRMGPFELMDLIGNDVNLKVSQSVFEAYNFEPRFRPSLLQRELVDARRLGRKSEQGFYSYTKGAQSAPARSEKVSADAMTWEELNLTKEQTRDGILIALTDGRTAQGRADEVGRPVIVFDLCGVIGDKGRVGFAISQDVSLAQKDSFVATLASQGFAATALPDWPGLVVLRTLAMIANEAFETVLHCVASEPDIDSAMRFGVNYPKGPISWSREIGLTRILNILDTLHALTGDMRYRASYQLRLSAQNNNY